MLRTTCTLITIVLIVIVTCTTALALTDIDDSSYKHSIETMMDLQILQGRGDGRFWPEAELTRAEAAKVAALISGFTEQDAIDAESWTPVFDDVYPNMGAHQWAVGWINLVEDQGIIQGYGDGNYYPGDNLQMVQWAAILIRILGYEQQDMSWPDSYTDLAHELELAAEIPFDARTNINRGEMAHMTNTTISIERPDGSKIIDSLPQPEPQPPADHDITDLSISVSIAADTIPEGGGQQVAITATITDQNNNPVSGALVRFYAGAHTNCRDNQLSPQETASTSSGIAQIIYTTVVADDGYPVDVAVTARINDVATEHRFTLIAADDTAKVSGIVTHPATGERVEGLDIIVSKPHSPFTLTTTTDASGYYEIFVPEGSFEFGFEFEGDLRDPVLRTLTAQDSPYTLNYDKGILTGKLTNFPADAVVMAIGPGFNPNDPGNFTLQSDVAPDGTFQIQLFPNTYELYITGDPWPFITDVTINTGQTTDIGTINL